MSNLSFGVGVEYCDLSVCPQAQCTARKHVSTVHTNLLSMFDPIRGAYIAYTVLPQPSDPLVGFQGWRFVARKEKLMRERKRRRGSKRYRNLERLDRHKLWDSANVKSH